MAPLVTGDELAAALGKPVPNTDATVDECANAADAWLIQFLRASDAEGQPIDHSAHDYCRRSALRVAVETWQGGKSAGGQPASLDFAPSPYTLGNSLLRMVSGLIAPCRDIGGLVG